MVRSFAPTPARHDALEREVESRFAAHDDIERLTLAMEGSQDGIWDLNVDAGTLYLSPRFKEILGYADEELSNSIESWERLLHPDDAERHVTALVDHFRGRTDFYKSELRLRRKDGTWAWIYMRGIARTLGVTHRSVINWVNARAAQLPDLPPVPADELDVNEIDELFTLVGNKKTKSMS